MSQHFWVDIYAPNGVKIGSSSSKSQNSEGQVLAELIATMIAEKRVKLAPATGNPLDSDATRLPVTAVVREWDGLTKKDRVKGMAWDMPVIGAAESEEDLA